MKFSDIDPQNPIYKGHIVTFTGRAINLFNPDPYDIRLFDIAHGLSNICRWGGHSKYFYSVAEHSLRIRQVAPTQLKPLALLHDAEEAYFGDIVKPLKDVMEEMCPELVQAMTRLRDIILEKYGVPWEQTIKVFDKSLLIDEFRGLVYCPEDKVTATLHPLAARDAFLEACREHFPKFFHELYYR